MYIIISLFILLITLLFVYSWYKHSYWKSKGVSTPPYLPIIGHMHQMFFLGYRWEQTDRVYYQNKMSGCWGVYELWRPTLFLSDLDNIKNVFVKDAADHFVDPRHFEFGTDSLFNEMLFLSKGEKWKSLRTVMTPTFSSGKIKSTFPLVQGKVCEFLENCRKIVEKDSAVDLKNEIGYYTMDIIGLVAFGIDAKCIEQKRSSQFIKQADRLVGGGSAKELIQIVLSVAPKLFQWLGISLPDVDSFFSKVIEKTVNSRKNKRPRGDFLDIMLEALAKHEENTAAKYTMTMNTVKAQSVLFLLAGHDTTDNALAITIYLLAKHTEIQEKLRQELNDIIKEDGELRYQNLMEATYLDACLSESLRLFPPAFLLERQCTADYRLPGIDIHIPKGMVIGIPVWSIHRDAEYWSDPLTYNPDRFLPENKTKIKPYTYMPFGLGPRNCLGMRFAQMEIKLLLAKMFLEYDVTLKPGFTEMVLEKTSFTTLRPNKDGIPIVLSKITTKI